MTNLLHSPYADLAREMLMLLDHEDLSSLVKTATSGHIVPVDTEEACTAILLSCPDVAKLLSHRKLSSSFLLQYLTLRGVSMKGHATRTQLVMSVVEHWEETMKSARRKKRKNIVIKNEPVVKEEPALYQFTNFKHEPECIIKTEPSFFKNAFIKEEPREYQNNSTQASFYSNSHRTGGGSGAVASCVTSSVILTNIRTNKDAGNPSSNGTVERVKSDEFAHDFCVWFYMMMNKLQPCCAAQGGDTLKPEIFCANCSLEMYLVEGERMEQCKASTNVECNNVVRELLSKLGLLFMPNIDGGINVKKSSHGIIQVSCCGTIHRNDAFVGIFEQEFGLVASPVDRTWKIAYSKINLKKLSEAYTPSLPRAEVFAIEY